MGVVNSYNYSKPKNYINVNILTPTANNTPKAATPSANPFNEKTDQYLEQRVLSAKPEELTYMLYEGLVRFIKRAMISLEAKDYEKVNYNARRAQNIVEELRNTLNMEIEMSTGLDQLYEFAEYKLFEANIEKNGEKFQEVLDLASDLKETWKTAFGLS